jgi:hypothetical protein
MRYNGGLELPISASYFDEVTREASSGRFKASCISSPVSRGLRMATPARFSQGLGLTAKAFARVL